MVTISKILSITFIYQGSLNWRYDIDFILVGATRSVTRSTILEHKNMFDSLQMVLTHWPLLEMSNLQWHVNFFSAYFITKYYRGTRKEDSAQAQDSSWGLRSNVLRIILALIRIYREVLWFSNVHGRRWLVFRRPCTLPSFHEKKKRACLPFSIYCWHSQEQTLRNTLQTSPSLKNLCSSHSTELFTGQLE